MELSKLHMFDFHYNVMKPLFGGNIEVLFSDTDSLCYHIKDSAMQEKLVSIRHMLDFSNYNQNHPLYSTENKCVPGK